MAGGFVCCLLLPAWLLYAQQPVTGAPQGRVELLHELTIAADPASSEYEFAVLGAAAAAFRPVVRVGL